MTEKHKEIKRYVEDEITNAEKWLITSEIKDFLTRFTVSGAMEEQKVLFAIIEKAFDCDVSAEELQEYINSLPERSFYR